MKIKLENIDLEDWIKTALFIPLIIGVAMIPAKGIYAFALIVPFASCLHCLHNICEKDRKMIREYEEFGND